MNEVILRVEALHERKCKKKAMKIVSNIAGIESVSVDMNENKLTLTGEMDAVEVVGKLRKLCHTEILSVGPATATATAKQEPKKNNKEHTTNLEASILPIQAYHYYYTSMEENPNACVIF
ncbi:hypothetical protein HN51_057137 [Arachis hypogaea]|uniref:HMA domain-containing protein n=1 Tax=Arachis hypogaea TaxID=3818 RepID=A0A6B9VFC6_ARAHY|nr:heavy metal-associated isoprenylated plant protein 12 [Arachis ipaensis]XP_025676800.1 heavy metal-associated isoprenylated plant protein 12 [Arachis hypogaea]QHN80163.1 uncharacterized protein DS421_19g675990 [Arachis hypogaea]